MYTDSTTHMKIALAQEWQEILKFKKINEEMLEYLSSSLRWLLHYKNRNNIPLPESEKIEEIVKRVMAFHARL